MCRWLAYSGSPIRLEGLLVKRDRSLIDQSLHSRQGATPTNGDGLTVALGQILDVADEQDAFVRDSLPFEQTDRRCEHERLRTGPLAVCLSRAGNSTTSG